MSTVTPRNLDPKFKDATPTEPDDATDTVTESDAVAVEPKGGFIVHKQPYVSSDGVQHVKVHGPMPISEWADYERENNL